MITKISPIQSLAHGSSDNRGRSSLALFILYCRVKAEAELTPEGEAASPHERPSISTDIGRQSRIAALKHELEFGTYNISAEQITDKMLTATLIDILV